MINANCKLYQLTPEEYIVEQIDRYYKTGNRGFIDMAKQTRACIMIHDKSGYTAKEYDDIDKSMWCLGYYPKPEFVNSISDEDIITYANILKKQGVGDSSKIWSNKNAKRCLHK